MSRTPDTPTFDSLNTQFADGGLPPYTIIGDLPASSVVDIVIPGRGRTEDGMDITPSGMARVGTAARFFFDYNLQEKGGFIVSSGAATPGDKAGPLLGDVTRREDFHGIPEAVSTDRHLAGMGVPRSARLLDVLSIDTATNLVFTNQVLLENGAGPSRALGVVSQKRQLERILEDIAPRVTNRPIVGIQVPEQAGKEEPDSLSARMFSRLVLRGMEPHNPDLSTVVYGRAERYWQRILSVKRLLGRSAVYNQNLGQGS